MAPGIHCRRHATSRFCVADMREYDCGADMRPVTFAAQTCANALSFLNYLTFCGLEIL